MSVAHHSVSLLLLSRTDSVSLSNTHSIDRHRCLHLRPLYLLLLLASSVVVNVTVTVGSLSAERLFSVSVHCFRHYLLHNHVTNTYSWLPSWVIADRSTAPELHADIESDATAAASDGL